MLKRCGDVDGCCQSLIHSSSPKNAQDIVRVSVGIQEQSPSIPIEWQGLNYLNHHHCLSVYSLAYN